MFRKRANNIPADYLIVGLGNPGPQYRHTRHNAGAEVIELLSRRYSKGRLESSKDSASVANVSIFDTQVVLAIPQTFMNNSGDAVARLMSSHSVGDVERVVIVHDELDLPIGVVKLKLGGGLGGHNGLRSIDQHLGNREFVRVRIGIGKPSDGGSGTDYVLGRPTPHERTDLEIAIERAADAVESLVSLGPVEAMNRFN